VAYEVDLFGRVRRSIEAAGRTQTRLPRHVMVCGCWSLRRRPEPTLRYARSERRSISRTIRLRSSSARLTSPRRVTTREAARGSRWSECSSGRRGHSDHRVSPAARPNARSRAAGDALRAGGASRPRPRPRRRWNSTGRTAVVAFAQAIIAEKGVRHGAVPADTGRCRSASPSRSSALATLHLRIHEGSLKAQKDGARTNITHAQLERYVQTCGV